MFQGIYTSSSHFLCSANCMLYCFFLLICSQVSIFQDRSNIFHRFVYYVFVVADKSNVICILLVNYIVSYGVFVLFYAVIMVMKMLNGY